MRQNIYSMSFSKWETLIEQPKSMSTLGILNWQSLLIKFLGIHSKGHNIFLEPLQPWYTNPGLTLLDKDLKSIIFLHKIDSWPTKLEVSTKKHRGIQTIKHIWVLQIYIHRSLKLQVWAEKPWSMRTFTG